MFLSHTYCYGIVPTYIVYYTLYPYITVMVRFLCDDVVLILCVIFLSVVKSAKYYSTCTTMCDEKDHIFFQKTFRVKNVLGHD
jgi:hypothetical protein